MNDSKIGIAFGAGSLMDMVLEKAYHVRLADPLALGRDSTGFYAYNDMVVFVEYF